MKTRISIHRGLFVESMRRLRTPALTILIISTIVGILSHVLMEFHFDNGTLYDFHPALYVIPFVAPFLLTVIGFHFQTKRCDSDFYHALPFTRTTLCASLLAAVAAWCGIITVGSSTVLCFLPMIFGNLSVLDMLLPMFATLVSCLFVASLTFTASQLCGRDVATVFAVPILLFSPTIIRTTFYEVLYYNFSVYPSLLDSHQAPARFNLLYNGSNHLSAWLWTGAMTILLLVIGFFIARRRPSETAGNAALHPAAQALIRLLISFVCCLPAMTEIIDYVAMDARYLDMVTVVTIYVLALVVYFLYELITTRSAKSLLRAIPWLGVLAALNVVCILLICFAAVPMIDSFQADPQKVNSISLTATTDFYSMAYEGRYADWNEEVPESYRDAYDLVTENPLFRNVDPDYEFSVYDDPYNGNYYIWDVRYNESRCVNARVKDPACIEMVCNAFATMQNDLANNRDITDTIFENAYGREWAVYRVTIDFHTGLLSRSRVVYLTETEYITLLNAINDIRPLPEFNFNLPVIE